MEQKKPEICLVVAVHHEPGTKFDGAIGKGGKDLYDIGCDRKRFQKITRGGIVIMGRKTAEAIPEDYFPLKSRINIPVTRNAHWNHPGVIVKESLETAIKYAQSIKVPQIFIIGGAEIYNEALEKQLIDRIYLTRILTPLPPETPNDDFRFLRTYHLIEGEKFYQVVDRGTEGEPFEDIETGLKLQFIEFERR